MTSDTDVLAQDLEAVRNAVDAERVVVLGHSMLGVFAVEYARHCPTSVSHVVLAGTPPIGDMASLQARGREFFDEDASPERKRLLKENLAKLPPGAPPSQAVYAQTPMRFYNAAFDATPLFAGAQPKIEVLMQILGTMLPGWDVTVGAEALRTPILVAHGRHDYVVPWVLWKDIVTALPSATLRVFEESGHQPFFEEPAEFVRVVTTWMAGRPTRASGEQSSSSSGSSGSLTR